jgi:N-acetylglucosaminyl-diphospho-decaprenol L-rhamnosyltransferase
VTTVGSASRAAAPERPVADAPITVAVVSWNTRELLADCLASLREDAGAGLADVWVVDNASADGSAAMVRERFPWVKLVASSENLGFGAAVNLVAARTASPWLAPANADLRFEPGALARLLAAAEAHPEAGAIAPRLILPDGSTQQSVYPFPTLPFTVAYLLGGLSVSHSLSRRWCLGSGFDPSKPRDVPWAVGAFLLVRRTSWDQAGGFDERQWMYAEDLDLGWRLRRAGWATRYEPAARVGHAESAATVQAWGPARHARWHASTYAWLARRRGRAFARLIAFVNVGGFLLRAGLQSPAAVAGSASARRARQDSLNAARAHAIGLRPIQPPERA